MKTEFLVLGASGSLGYAVVKALLDQQIATTILVRDYEKALRLFGSHPMLRVVVGKADNTLLLDELCTGKTHVFHGLNVDYELWAEVMPALTRNVINAAARHKVTLVFPGNNYNFGNLKQPITEITPFQPATQLGKVRVELEAQIKDAARLGRIKALIVRLPEVWGPNVCNKSFEPVFMNQLKGKSMPWLFDIESPQQMAYNMDAGRAIAALSLLQTDRAYQALNYGGSTFSSMRDFFHQLAQVAEKPLKISVMSKGLISLLAKVNPTLKQVKTLHYKFENTILLDDSAFQSVLPDFEPTETSTAMAETLDWFSSHKLLPASQIKKQKRNNLIMDFMADNFSIGIFPVLIGLMSRQFPALQSLTVLLGVVAGIYWSPLIRKLLRRLIPVKKLSAGLLVLALSGLIHNTVSAQHSKEVESVRFFDGLYGKVEAGSQHVFSGALIDGIDVLAQESTLVSSIAMGFRKQIASGRVVIGTELQLGFIDGDLAKNYHNGIQMLSIDYRSGTQTALGLTAGIAMGTSKKWQIYTYAYSTKRSFDISFTEENGYEHQQTDNNIFLRYGLGLESVLNNRWSVTGSLGQVQVDFGEAIKSENLTQRADIGIGFIYRF